MRGKKGILQSNRQASGVIPTYKGPVIEVSLHAFKKYIYEREYPTLDPPIMRKADLEELKQYQNIKQAWDKTSDLGIMFLMIGYIHQENNKVHESLYNFGKEYIAEHKAKAQELLLNEEWKVVEEAWQLVQHYPLDNEGLRKARRRIILLREPFDEEVNTDDCQRIIEMVSQLSILAQNYRSDITEECGKQLGIIYEKISASEAENGMNDPDSTRAYEQERMLNLLKDKLTKELFANSTHS